MIQKVKSRTDIIDSTLERRKPRSSVRHRIMLEREESRSSVDCTLPEVLQALTPTRASNSPLERRSKNKGSRSSVKTTARAEELQSKILGDGKSRSSVKIPARAEKQQRRDRSSVKTSARA